jgi:hypothetical protein
VLARTTNKCEFQGLQVSCYFCVYTMTAGNRQTDIANRGIVV